jgi:hypothetical protein
VNLSGIVSATLSRKEVALNGRKNKRLEDILKFYRRGDIERKGFEKLTYRPYFKKIVIFFSSIVLMLFSIAALGMDKGEENKDLFGGSRGKVPFPHRLHQENLDDCNVCHGIFPQVSGSIEDLKSKGKLEKKQVMNKLCVACHRTEKRAGNKGGPTTCSKCHVR